MENLIFDTNRPVREYFKLALPVVFGMLITLVYNLVDTFFIGHTNNADLVAGVSLCAPAFTLLMAFGNIFGQGGNSLISRALGQKDFERIRRISAFCFRKAIASGIMLTVIGFICFDPILSVLGASANTHKFAAKYLSVLLAGAPLIVFSFVPNNLIRSEGLAIESMIGTILGAVANIILDPVFIFVFGLGAQGAAIATVLGYVLTDVYYIWIVKKKSSILSLARKDSMLSRAQRSEVFGIGISAAITNIAQSICVILLNQSLLAYGSEQIAAMGIVLKATMIVQLILTGFAFGGAPLYGFLYGSQEEALLKKMIRFCMIWIGILALILSVPLLLFPENVLSIFIEVDKVIEAGIPMLRWQCAGLVLGGEVLFLTVLFQATGKMLPSYVLSLSRQGILFIVILLVMTRLFGYTGILASQAAADVVSGLLAFMLYFAIFQEKTSVQTIAR